MEAEVRREGHMRDRVRLLLETSRALAHEPSLEALFERLFQLISTRLDTDVFFIAFTTPEHDALEEALFVDHGVRGELRTLRLSGSIAGAVFRSGEPLIVRKADEFERLGATMRSRSCSAVFAPIRVGDRTIGVLSTQSDREDAYDENAIDLLVAIGEQTAIAIENVRHRRQIEEQRRELELLVDVARGLASDEFSVEQMCRRVCDQVRGVMDANVFYVVLLNEERTSFTTEFCIDGDREYILGDHSVDSTLLGSVIAANEPLVLDDVSKEKRGRRFGFVGDSSAVTGSLVMVPLCAGEKVIGVVCAQSTQKQAFDESAVRILQSIANQLALAIKNVQLYRATEKRADRDALTNVFNRRYALRRLNDELDRAARNSSKVGVMMLDLDGLKRINDTFGHLAGDLAIRGVADALQRMCRKSDTVARMGGDEFIVIMPDLRDDRMEAVRSRINAELHRTQIELRPGITAPLNASLGFAASTPKMAPNDLIAHADAALYRDKSSRTHRRAG